MPMKGQHSLIPAFSGTWKGELLNHLLASIVSAQCGWAAGGRVFDRVDAGNSGAQIQGYSRTGDRMVLEIRPTWKRDAAVGVIAGLGIATFVTVYLHVQRLDGVPGRLSVVVFFGVFLSAPLVIGGLYLLTQEFEPGESLRVAGWVLLGSVPLVLITSLLVLFSEALEVVLGDPFILLSGLVGLGGLAGLAFGLYELELRAAKATVQETANRMDAIITGSPIPIVALDPDGVVTMWNEAAEETFRYKREEVIGESYPLAPADRSAEFSEHLDQLAAGTDLLGVQTVRERKDGVLLDVEIWTSRLLDSDGEFDGVVALVADISDRKRREQEVQVLHRVLRHNLRNDLNVIHGNAARIEETLEPLSSLLDRFEQENVDFEGKSEPEIPTEEVHSRLLSTVSPSLDYATLMQRKSEELIALTEKAQRAETILRSIQDEHHPIEVRSLIDHPLRDLELEYPDATLSVEIEEDLQVLVNGPLGVAVRELAENAVVHSTNETPTLRLTACQRAGRACIEVHDEGPGIPAEERRVIAEGEESSMLHSSGLGLWLSNWLVNRSGGTLTFEENGEGTIARIELPLAQPEPTTPRPRKNPHA